MQSLKTSTVLAVLFGLCVTAYCVQATNTYTITNTSGEYIGLVVVNLDDNTTVGVEVAVNGDYPFTTGNANIVSLTINNQTVTVGNTADVRLASGIVVQVEVKWVIGDLTMGIS